MFHSFQAKHVSPIPSETCKTVLRETCKLHLSEICLNLSERNMFKRNMYRIINPQETQQVAARDEKWVPFTERVKISSTNVRLETTVPQKEEAFQVVIDLIKNSSYFKAFTISVDVPEIFMQQFWYSIKKVQGTNSYEFLLANKKCVVNADVFRTILDICPRVEGVNFTDVPDDDTTLDFLIKLGYKGPLYKHTNMFVDHMHQPWRTLAAIIDKCLSGKTTSNDKLCKSRIDILWGMFYRENVDYPELIWEDLAYQIDHRKEKRSRRENMPFPRFTKVIINHFLKQHNSLLNLKFQHYHTIKDDGIVCRLKFVRIGKDYQEYGLPIPETMLTEKTDDDSQETVDVSEESEPEPEPELVKRKTSSKRRVKKKVTLSVDDNIISSDLDTTLELGKSISKTEAEEAEAARQVNATHARIVTESVPESTKIKKSGNVTSDPPKKLKDVPSLTLEEQEAANIMQALKESKKTSNRQLGTRGSSEGTGTIPGVPDESTVVSATSSEGIEDKLDNEEKDDKEGDDETESDEDEIYKYKIRVRKDEDEEMLNAEVEDSDKGGRRGYLMPQRRKRKDFRRHYKINSLLEVKIQSKVPHNQSPSMLSVPMSVISEPSILTPLRVSKLEKDVFELKKIDISAESLAALKTQVPSIVYNYLASKVGDNKAALKEYDQKSALYQTMHANKSFNRNPANHRLYHALMEALIEDENAMDKGVADTVQDHKRKHDDDEDDDDEDPPAGPNQGKALSKGSKTSKSALAKELIKEPIAEVVMDDAGDDVVHDDDQPQDTSEPKTTKTLNPDWFTQPPRPPTLDSE
ncbi:hypothetical protein Tco_0666826 [Tanacetum coccineum]